MPIEDASVLWSEDESPYVRVAKITYPIQHAYSDDRMVYGDDVLEFNSWRSIDDSPPARLDQPTQEGRLPRVERIPAREERPDTSRTPRRRGLPD